jgi:hypothetical protein
VPELLRGLRQVSINRLRYSAIMGADEIRCFSKDRAAAYNQDAAFKTLQNYQ